MLPRVCYFEMVSEWRFAHADCSARARPTGRHYVWGGLSICRPGCGIVCRGAPRPGDAAVCVAGSVERDVRDALDDRITGRCGCAARLAATSYTTDWGFDYLHAFTGAGSGVAGIKPRQDAPVFANGDRGELAGRVQRNCSLSLDRVEIPVADSEQYSFRGGIAGV